MNLWGLCHLPNMIEVTLEIEYEYYGYERPTVGWMYKKIKGTDIKDCKDKALKAYNTYISGLGWKKLTKLVEIRLQRHGNEPPLKTISDSLSDERTVGRISKSNPRAIEKASRPRAKAGTTKAGNRGTKGGAGDSAKRKKDPTDAGSSGRKRATAAKPAKRTKKTKRS